MTTTRRIAAVTAVSATLVLGLSGCQLLTPMTNEVPATAMQSCALGATWALNTETLAADLTATVGVPVTVEGGQTLTWDDKGSVSIASDYTLVGVTSPAEGSTITVRQTHSGTTTGRALINGDIAIPSKWDASGAEITTAADQDGTALEEIPFGFPATDLDDKVGLLLTCEGDTLTTTARGGKFTQTWIRQG